MTGRQKPVKSINNITLGYTSLKTGAVTIDVYTPKNRKPKSFASILRTIAHEIAHHQKKPYRQFYRGRWIIRKHYPAFYHRVNKNITQLKKDVILGQYFNTPNKKRELLTTDASAGFLDSSSDKRLGKD